MSQTTPIAHRNEPTKATTAPTAHAKSIKRVAVGTVNEVVLVRATVELDEPTYDILASQAIARGITPEELMSERLRIARDWTGEGIHFNIAQARRLGAAIGHTVSDAEGALSRLETICTLTVGDFSIVLEPRLLQRLRTRVFRGQTLEKVVEQQVILGLKRFCGLEPA